MFTYCIQSTLLENITFICTSFRSRKGSDSCHLFFHLYNIWIASLIQYYASIDDLHIFPLIFACNKTIIKLPSWCKLTVRRCLGWSVNIIFLFFNVMLFFDKHTIVDMFCSKWASYIYIYIESEWIAQCQFSNFSAISWQEQVNFQWDDDEVRLY